MKERSISKLFILFGIIMSIPGCAAKEKETGQGEIITETTEETSEISESNTVPKVKPEPDVVENTDSIEEEEGEKEYVFSESSERFMEKKDLFGIDQETLRIGRNEIYARHGRRFSDTNLNLTEDEKKVYRILSRTMLKPISEIAPYAEFGKSKTTQLLKEMSKKGVVKIEGKGRGTKYMIK